MWFRGRVCVPLSPRERVREGVRDAFSGERAWEPCSGDMHPGIGRMTGGSLAAKACNGVSGRKTPSPGRLKAADLSRGER